jgi:hypothetical protein
MSETKQPYSTGKVTASIYRPDDWTPIKSVFDVMEKDAEPPASITVEMTHEDRKYKGVLHLVEGQEDALPTHDGGLGDGRYVEYVNSVWSETADDDVPGIGLGKRGDYYYLTAAQALSLLEWLRQQEPILKQKAQNTPVQG